MTGNECVISKEGRKLIRGLKCVVIMQTFDAQILGTLKYRQTDLS